MNPSDTSDPDGAFQAKQRFISAAIEIDPFNPIRKHPLAAVGTAAALGAVAATPAVEKSIVFTRLVERLVLTALPVVNQVVSGVRFAVRQHEEHLKKHPQDIK